MLKIIFVRYSYYVQFSSLPGVSSLGGGDCSDRRIRMNPDPDDWCLSYIIYAAIFLSFAERRNKAHSYSVSQTFQ